jgi:hypothetical protein
VGLAEDEAAVAASGTEATPAKSEAGAAIAQLHLRPLVAEATGVIDRVGRKSDALALALGLGSVKTWTPLQVNFEKALKLLCLKRQAYRDAESSQTQRQ